MVVTVKGQFLENGSYHSEKKNADVYYATILVGATALQVNNLQVPNVKRLEDITLEVDMRAFGNSLVATAVQR